MSKARNALERQIIEVAKKTNTTTQQRVIEIGTLLSKLEDTIAREKEEREAEVQASMLPRAELETLIESRASARRLLCDLWATFPQVHGLMTARRGNWFGFGVDRESDYVGRDLSGTPEAAVESGPAMILSREEIIEILSQTLGDVEGSEGAHVEAAQKLLEKAWEKGTPSSHWKVKGEEDPHKGHYDGERSELALGKYTDDQLANGAFLNYDRPFNVQDIISGRQIAPISWMTGVKDRIRWLSRALEKTLKEKAELQAKETP